MNLVFRLALILLRAARSPKTPLMAIYRDRFRTWPHDLRLRDHLHNQRFFNFMELGRFSLWRKSRMDKPHFKLRVIAAQDLFYIRQIGWLKSFEVSSQLAGWDHKYVYYRHEFRDGDTLFATGRVKEACMNKEGIVSPLTFLGEAPTMPQEIQDWIKSQNTLKKTPIAERL